MMNYTSTPAVQAGGMRIPLNSVMRNVYGWMTGGLAVSAVISFLLTQWIVTGLQAGDVGPLSTVSGLMLPIILVQLGIAIGLGFMYRRASSNVVAGLFLTYAATMGVTLSVIFTGVIAGGAEVNSITGQISFDSSGLWAIVKALAVTCGLFGTMTVVGYTTKTDLTRFGSFLMMALIGMFIASIVNIFLRSDAMSWIISVVGVLVFTGMTAWDTQKIKNMALEAEASGMAGSEEVRKLSIMGAMELYLDFINLFIYLLRIFASSRD